MRPARLSRERMRGLFDLRSRGRENMWMRSCAVCKVLLKKPRLWDSVYCKCGWEWQSAGAVREKLIVFPEATKKSA